MKKQTAWKIVKRVLFLVCGTALMALAVNCIFEPMELVTGGLTGLGIILNHILEHLGLWKVPLWLVSLVGNVPLLIWAYVQRGKSLLGGTLMGTLLHTFFLYIIPPMQLLDGDYLLSAAAGGIFMGLGIGLVFSAHASTGGSDLLSILLAGKDNPNAAPGILMFLDGAVVAASVFVLGVNIALYSLLVVVIFSKVSDAVLEGMHFAKAIYIMSDRADEISDALLRQIDRGVTEFHSRGMYTRREGATVFCVIARRELTKLLATVREIDPGAFVVIQDVRSVRGEGFIENPQ